MKKIKKIISSNQTNDSLNSKLKKIENTRENNFDFIPLQSEVIELRLKMISQLLSHKYNTIFNLKKCEIETIRHYLKYKPFEILQCDKNVGSILFNKSNELELALKHLNDKKTYELVNESEFENIFKNKNLQIETLYKTKHIPTEIYNKL